MYGSGQGQDSNSNTDTEQAVGAVASGHAPSQQDGPLKVLLLGLTPTVAAACSEAITGHYGNDTQIASGPVQDDNSLADYDFALIQLGPQGSELDQLGQLHEKRPDLPTLLLSDENQRGVALEGIRRGAYDNIVTVGNYLATLPLSIEKNLAIRQIRLENKALHDELAKTVDEVRVKNTQLEEAVSQLQTVASTDPLTNLDNRRSLDRMLEQHYAQADRYTHDLTLLMIDIDQFKLINDTFGHQAGDEVLRMAARVLEANCRKSDTAGRMGGDEFMVILPQTNMVTAFKVAKRIKTEFDEGLKAKFSDAQDMPAVSMSIGAASLRQSKPSGLTELISFADQALYSAKQSEKTPVVAYAKRVAIKVGAATPEQPVTGDRTDKAGSSQ